MSFETMAICNKIKTGSSVTKLVLLMLADRMNKDTNECYPSIKKIAEDCELSQSSVKTHLKKLASMDIIRITTRKIGVVNLPNIYRFIYNPIRQEITKGTAGADPGVGQEITEGGSGGDYEPINEPISITSKLTKEINKEKKVNGSFNIFWETYDKKVDKQKSETKWKTMSVADRDSCLKVLPYYIKSKPDKCYRKSPYGFLLNRNWEDEIIYKSNTNNVNINRVFNNNNTPTMAGDRDEYG